MSYTRFTRLLRGSLSLSESLSSCSGVFTRKSGQYPSPSSSESLPYSRILLLTLVSLVITFFQLLAFPNPNPIPKCFFTKTWKMVKHVLKIMCPFGYVKFNNKFILVARTLITTTEIVTRGLIVSVREVCNLWRSQPAIPNVCIKVEGVHIRCQHSLPTKCVLKVT